jgi:lysozyme
MIPSDRCIELIKQSEGLSLKKYVCPAGYDTIGYGHKISHGEMIWCVDGISGSTAIHLLNLDMEKFGRAVTAMTAGIQLSQNQFDALVDLSFNVGSENVESSTLLRKLKAGDVQGAAEEFLRWDHMHRDGHLIVNEGLRKRRLADEALFLGLPTAA